MSQANAADTYVRQHSAQFVRTGGGCSFVIRDSNGVEVERIPVPGGVVLGSLPSEWLLCRTCYRESAHPYSISTAVIDDVRAFLSAHARHVG